MLKNHKINHNETSNIVKNKNINFFKNCFLLNFSLLSHNVFFWIFLFLYGTSFILINVVYIVINKALIIDNLFLTFIVSFAMEMFFIFICVARLFCESRFNSIDMILITKPYKKKYIYFSRFFFILSAILLINILQFLLLMILFFVYGFNYNLVIFYLVSLIFISPLISSCIISIFTLFALYFRKIYFSLATMAILFISSLLPIFTRNFNPTNNLIEFDVNKNNSFSKITYLDSSNKPITFLVDKTKNNIGDDYLNNLNSDCFYQYLIPGEWFNSLYSQLASNLLFESNLNYNNNKPFSLIKWNYINNNVYLNNLNILTLKPQDLNPYDLSNNEYEKLLIKLFNELYTNKLNNFINFKDQLYIDSFINKLKNTPIWNDKNNGLSNKELNSIKALFGLEDNYSQLYYYWRYNDLLSTKTPQLFTTLNSLFNPSFVQLINYLYTSNNSRINLINLKIFGDLSKLMPSSFSFNLNALPLPNDVDFIINYLFRFNQNQVAFLDLNQNYQIININTLQQIDPSIIDFNTYKTYILQNTMTLRDAKNLINKFKQIPQLNNLYSFNFNPNYFNPYQYSLYLQMNIRPYLNYNAVLVILIIFITIICNYLSYVKFNHLNYKNIEV